ncbi:MAG: hypothetical protein SYC29_01635 [Planctomycetota bacterium]|nr:hypothetical protein [Planctomycetota bacterium]
MTGEGYLVLGYIVGLGLLLGYAILLWLAGRSLDKREPREDQGPTG